MKRSKCFSRFKTRSWFLSVVSLFSILSSFCGSLCFVFLFPLHDRPLARARLCSDVTEPRRHSSRLLAPRAAFLVRPPQHIEVPARCRPVARLFVPRAAVPVCPLQHLEVSAHCRKCARLRCTRKDEYALVDSTTLHLRKSVWVPHAPLVAAVVAVYTSRLERWSKKASEEGAALIPR